MNISVARASLARRWALKAASSALIAGGIVLPAAPPLGAQVAIKRAASGFNLFSIEKDIEVGRRSALDFERRLPVVKGARPERFLAAIVAVLAREAPGPRFAFEARAVQSPDVHLLALPGGQVFVTRGLLALARSEAQVAGVIAHAMAHAILQHGTAQVSRAWVRTAGLAALGGLAGPDGHARIIEATGGYGSGAAFLTFSPADEYAADALGAELLARAGYDAVSLSVVLSALRRDRRADGFFALHPAPRDREARIRNLANILGHGGAQEIVGGFAGIRWGNAGSMTIDLASATAPPDTAVGAATPFMPRLDLPSTRFTRYTHRDGRLSIEHPSNWDVHHSGSSVTFAPPGGIVERNGQPALVQGAVVNTWAPFDSDVDRWNESRSRYFAPFDRNRPRKLLEDATDDLVRQLLAASPWLDAPNGSAQARTIDGTRGYLVRLGGRSPVTGEGERLEVHTRVLEQDHVVYLACITPERMGAAVERACARMSQSLRASEAAASRP